jgi:uncharacterized protein YndB with AHSA1/START domain
MPDTTETLTLERDYAAPPQRVFQAWTEIELVRPWFGCATEKLWHVHEWDVREGGRLHVSLDFDGQPFDVHGEFLVVDPPRRLTYRWSENELVEVTIEPYGSGSRLRLAHTFPAGGPEGAVRTVGWTYSLDQLGLIPHPVV